MTKRVRASVGALGLYLAFFVALLNVSVMYLAVPRVEQAFHADLSVQQWFVGIYPLMQGGFILAAGTFGDLWGRRRALLLGVALFAAASVAAALAPNATFLVVARAFEGIGSATLLALPPAMLIAMLPTGGDEAPTVARIALWGGIASGIAPLVGGAVVERFSWQGVFWLSAVMAAVAFALIAWCGRNEPKPAGARRLDAPGQTIAIFAFLALSYGFIDGDARGWASPTIVASFVAGGAALFAFVAIERRVAQPMIDLRYFRIRAFDVSLGVLSIVNFAWFGLALLAAVFLQEIRGEDPFRAGLYLLPCSVAFFAANAGSERFVRRLGFANAVVVSFAISIAGIAWLGFMTVASRGWEVALALAVAGIGWGLITSPGTALGMESAAKSDEGFASATQALVRALFGVFGIALLGSLPGNSVASEAFMQGWPIAMAVCGIATIAAGTAIVLFARRRDADPPSVESGSA